jgi:hypothetical protein
MTNFDKPARVVVKAVSTPDELFDFLNPRDARWSSEPWIFRGHGDSRWSLVPSAFREPLPPWKNLNSRGESYSFLTQMLLEWTWLQHFLIQVNEGGLRFAAGNETVVSTTAQQSLASEFFRRFGDCSPKDWPPADLLPNLALAQHHGIPTCLMDWTESPYVAMYFAAAKAAAFSAGIEDRPNDWSGFSIWALNRSYLFTFEILECPFARVVTLPHAANPNLHAQSGLFIHFWDNSATKSGLPFTPRTLDEIIREAPKYAKLAPDAVVDIPSCALVRIDVPEAITMPVLRDLALLGYSPSKLFPGYDGAARAVKESYIWTAALPHRV